MLSEKVLEVLTLYSPHDKLYVLLESLAGLFNKYNELVSIPLLKVIIEIAKNSKLPSANRISSVDIIFSIDLQTIELIILKDILALGFVLMTEVDYYNDIQA